MVELTSVYPLSRFLSLVLLGGSMFMFVTDSMPFAFNFRLTFEYGALFYPALANLLFSVVACITFLRQDLRREALPLVATAGFVAVFFTLFAAIFAIVALAMYNYDIVVSGSNYFNLLGLCWIVFRLYAIVQIALTLLLIRCSHTLHANPGIEFHYLQSLKMQRAPKLPFNTSTQSNLLEKSREEVV